jgi:hypothetical protein
LSIAAVDRLDKHFRQLTKAVFSRYGFAYGEVLSRWSAIVGEELGAMSAPERIRWPRASGTGSQGRKSGGTLLLRVAEGRGLEFQHLAPRIIERINGFYGYQAVTAVKVLQGGLAAPSAPARKSAANPESPEGGAPGLEAIEDEALRAALLRLGAALSHRDAKSHEIIPSTGITA